jgi:3-ketosteroid 9alpha-monooxygenase subunit A
VNRLEKILRQTFVGRLVSPIQGLIEGARAELANIEHDETDLTPGGWAKWVTPGWYFAARSCDLKAGQVTQVRIGGKGLALFRTENGQAVISDLYCPHFGANLGTGKVIGETLQCPFHMWRYDTSGRCVHIPNCTKIPPKAVVKTYPVVERFQVIWLFVGDHRYYELPGEEEVFGGPFLIGGMKDFGSVRVDCRDVYENFLDVTHAKTIHNYDVKNFKLIEMDTSKRRVQQSGEVYLTKKLRIDITSTLYGTGLYVAHMVGAQYLHPAFWIVAVQPVGPLTTRILLTSAMQPRGQLVRDKFWSKWYAFAHIAGAKADIPIWNNKVIQENPVLCASDIGPIRKFRRYWAELDRIGRTGVESTETIDLDSHASDLGPLPNHSNGNGAARIGTP